MSGAREGLAFLFRPDFSQLTFSTILAALGQAFFSLSIAMGCLCTYASYFSRSTNLTRTAFQVAGIDTLVAIMASIIIFPADALSVSVKLPVKSASSASICSPRLLQAIGSVK